MLIKFSFTRHVCWHFSSIYQTQTLTRKKRHPKLTFSRRSLTSTWCSALLLLLSNVSKIKLKISAYKKNVSNEAIRDFCWSSCSQSKDNTVKHKALFYCFTTCWFHGNCEHYDSPAGNIFDVLWCIRFVCWVNFHIPWSLEN